LLCLEGQDDEAAGGLSLRTYQHALSSPLSDTLARVGALDSHLAAELGPLNEGWFPATTLLTPGSAILAEGLARSIARCPGAERRVAGSFFAGEYAWSVPAAAVAAFLAEGRVPDLALENIALRYCTYTWVEDGESGEGERIDVRFLSGRFAALPDDPAADHADARILPDIHALRTWLREGLESHLAPIIKAVEDQTRLGRRAQWNLAADSLAALFLHAGRHLGDEARGQAEGLACVKAPGSPLLNRDTGYLTVEVRGHCETFRAHGGCCLYYRVQPGENCSTCVLRPPAERVQKLRDYVARKHNLEVPA
jgi:hypothetical protein